MKETQPQPKPEKSLVHKEADQAVTDYMIKQVKRAVVCGCKGCFSDANQTMDWYSYPKEATKDFKEHVMDMFRKEYIDSKNER